MLQVFLVSILSLSKNDVAIKIIIGLIIDYYLMDTRGTFRITHQ
jgi:hypothetical protein